MPRDLKLYLWDMIRAGENIQQFLSGVSFADYEQSSLLRGAVERYFEIIGEAMCQATDHYPDLKDKIGEHREIVDFRNRIIHGYFAVDDRIVYSTAEDFLPELLDQVRLILAELPE